MKGLRIGKRRARSDGQSGSPLELALRPALVDGRWDVPARFNFARDVVEALAADPKRQALTFIGDDAVIEPRTFLEVAEGAARWATILAERSVRAEDRVIVLAAGSLQWLEIVLGAMKVGAVIVPCAPSLSASALEARVSSTDAALVIAERACEGAIEQMSFAPEVHYVDEGHGRRSTDGPATAPTHDTSARDVAFVFTSPGASGPPKEIAHTHAAVFAARAQAEHWLQAGRGDVVWCTADADSPLYVWLSVVGPWSRGAEIVVHRGEFDPLARLEHVYRLGATILCQSPAEYRAIAEVPRLERFRAPRLRRLVSTGELLEPEVRQVFEERWNLTIHDGYGQAETGVFIAGGREDAVYPGTIGVPLPGYEAAIVDDQGGELPPGIEGDLALRGQPPTLFAGYWEAADDTKRAFRGDWYLTGDVAMKDEEGRFVFVGRAEDVITSSGRTFGPYGVEHVLRSHAAVAGAAVVGMRDLQRGGHFVRAFVVPARGAEGSELLEAELRRHVADVLPEQQVPRDIVFVDALPLVAGKISRDTLREQPVSGRPLWETTATSEGEAAVQAAPAPEAVPTQVAQPQESIVTRAAAYAPAAPSAAVPETPPAPVEPVPVAEPEPVVFVAPEAEPIAEPEPVAVVAPEPVPVVEPEPMPEPVAFVAPEPAPAREPEPIVEPQPVALVEPEAVPMVEPEPVVAVDPDPEPAAEPEPVALVAPEPVPVVEPEPAAVVEPEPAESQAPAPAADETPRSIVRDEPPAEAVPQAPQLLADTVLATPPPIPSTDAVSGPEPEPAVAPEPLPEPLAEPVAEVATLRESPSPPEAVGAERVPTHASEQTAEPAPPEQPVEPESEQTPALTIVAPSETTPQAAEEGPSVLSPWELAEPGLEVIAPEHVHAAPDGQPPASEAGAAEATTLEPEPEPGPLPDFVITPAATPERAAATPDRAEAAPEPAPEPIAELEPLPDYIVDPDRPAPPKDEDAPRRQAAEAPPQVFPGLVPPPEPRPEPSGAEAAGIYFPPVTSFPTPRVEEAPDQTPRDARKNARRRPPADTDTPRSRRSQEEPGDDAADAGWMAGLSNRLSAYSLAEDGDEPGEPGPAADDEN